MKKILYFLFLSLLINSCTSFAVNIPVINYTDDNFVTYSSYSDSLGAIEDSLQSEYYRSYGYHDKEIICTDDMHYAKKKDKAYFKFQRKSRTNIFRNSPDGKVRFFFIKDSIFYNIQWDTIVKYQMYDRKLTYSEKDLELLDWVIEIK